jgi:hypothetical protein
LEGDITQPSSFQEYGRMTRLGEMDAI